MDYVYDIPMVCKESLFRACGEEWGGEGEGSDSEGAGMREAGV